VVLCTDEVYRAFYDDTVSRAFLHSHSYTGNALACRAALATLDIFEQDDVIVANRGRATRFTEQLQGLRDHPRVSHFRQLGMLWACDITDAPADFSRRFFSAALEREILLRPIGNTLYFMPPYVLDEASGELLASRALDALNAVLA
jgi:adenosylmethionine-8-amino-7-oxononanoate aminotransferase